MGFPGGAVVKNPPVSARGVRVRFNPWVRKWQPTAVFLLGNFHGQRSLADYSPWGCKELHTTEHAHAHTTGHLETISPFPYLPPSVISSVSLRFTCNTVPLYLMQSVVLVDQIEFESNSAVYLNEIVSI